MDIKNIVQKIDGAFKRFVVKDNISESDSKIMIYIGESEDKPIQYWLFDKEKPKREVSIKDDVLQVLIDIMNKTNIINAFMLNSIINLSKKYNYNPDECFFYLFKDTNTHLIKIQFCNKDNKVHEVTFDEIFKQENLI